MSVAAMVGGYRRASVSRLRQKRHFAGAGWLARGGKACCDLYGNALGDWVDCVEGQQGQDGNPSEGPLVCDQAGEAPA